jgi:hypothetical protein
VRYPRDVRRSHFSLVSRLSRMPVSDSLHHTRGASGYTSRNRSRMPSHLSLQGSYIRTPKSDRPNYSRQTFRVEMFVFAYKSTLRVRKSESKSLYCLSGNVCSKFTLTYPASSCYYLQFLTVIDSIPFVY